MTKTNPRRRKRPRWRLAAALTVVMMLVLVSGIMAVELLLKVIDNTPATSMDMLPVTLAVSDKEEISNTAGKTDTAGKSDNTDISDNNNVSDKKDSSSVNLTDVSTGETEEEEEDKTMFERLAQWIAGLIIDLLQEIDTDAIETKLSEVLAEAIGKMESSLPASVNAEKLAQRITELVENAVKDFSDTLYETFDVPKPGLEVLDKNGLWSSQTQIEIFRAEYENASGEVTVKSINGEKLIAPGTSNIYDFYINNIGEVALDYTVSAEATVTYGTGSCTMPLEVRFVDWKGNYVFGSENRWMPVKSFDGFTTKDSVSAKHYAKYSLQWQWPFEGDDELDTLLGNIAAKGAPIVVTIKLMVYATDALDPDIISGIPITGDSTQIGLWMAVFVCSAFMIPILLLLVRRKKDED